MNISALQVNKKSNYRSTNCYSTWISFSVFLAETFLDVSSGAPRSTPRGSHRTSFIEYVSEVYNNTKGHTSGGPHMEVLSVRGHSISSGSVASGSSSLARDISIRSENVQSNRVLSGRLRQREATKSARISSGGKHNRYCWTWLVKPMEKF